VPLFDVRGQERAQRILLRALAGERMPHAYIFHGPQGVGKRMLADRLAAILLCPNRGKTSAPDWAAKSLGDLACVDACGRCDDCRALAAGTHPDMHPIYRELHQHHPDSDVRRRKGLDLGIDVIRHFLIDVAGHSPMRGKAKVFIIEEAERLNPSAQNALLKTLEEPPPTTYLILLTRSIDRLLPTTCSRCQHVPFSALPTAFVEEKLRELRPDLPPSDAAYLARLSNGRLGVAALFADDGVPDMKRALGDELAGLSAANALPFAKSISERAGAYAKKLGEREDADSGATEATRVGLRSLLSVLAAFYNDALRCACGAAAAVVNADQPNVVDAVVRRHSRRGLIRAIRDIVDTESAIDRNANVALTLEAMAIRLTRPG
jgi:DNA polymerase-3 subunit delta'